MTTFWIIALGIYFLADLAFKKSPTTELEAGAAVAIMFIALLAGDVMGLVRARQTHSWAWGIPLAILLVFSLSMIPLAIFVDLLPPHVFGGLSFLLLFMQMIVLGVFGWWGPRLLPARPKAQTISAHVRS